MTDPSDREQRVLEAIERRRRRPRRKLREERVTLAHGAGGKASRDLLDALLLPALVNPLLEPLGDAAVLPAPQASGPRLALTTDSFVVRPLRFPGGDIGELAVNGTINDLSMVGARPLALSVGLIVEEGLPVAELEAIVGSLGAAARAAGVFVATGDTKVVERGKADGLYVNTAGVGVLEHDLALSPTAMRPGDRVLVSGPLGDHGMAIMLARGEVELESELRSDTAPLHGLVAALLAATPAVRCLRDPTRGGLASVLNELAMSAELAIVLEEEAIPVRPEVNGACEILGIDPLYVACEGRCVAVVAAEAADVALAAMRAHPLGAQATAIGEVQAEPPGMVLLEAAFGGSRVVDVLVGDPLPRIC